MSYSRRTLAADKRRMLNSAGIVHAEAPFRLPGSLTFVLAVAGGVLTVLNEDLGCCVQSDGLRFGDQEQHDKLLAHDAQRLVFPVASGYEAKKNKKAPASYSYFLVSVVLILESLTLTVSVVSLRALVLAAQASLRGLHPQLHVEVVALLPSSLLQLLQRGLQVLPAIPGVAVLRYSAHDHKRLEHVDDVVDTPPLDS